jgi:hypothetical protein
VVEVYKFFHLTKPDSVAIGVVAMELFFGSEKKGRSEDDVKPIRSSYEDQFGKTDWIYARYAHQLTGETTTTVQAN